MSFEDRKIFDISPRISAQTPVFPGDVSFSRNESMSFDKKDHLRLSSINSTLHIGSHADAPNHYHRDGIGIDERNLRHYLGSVQVIDLSEIKPSLIEKSHFENCEITEIRVLFKTKSFAHDKKWSDHFSSISTEVIDYLASKSVITVGIDTPSVDSADSKQLLAHSKIYENDMAILEGIDLDVVAAGIYDLVALPLKIKDGDASPVRAILLQ